MKIETLLRCLETSVTNFENAYMERSVVLAEAKASRQNLAFRKGIIRKFERLESRTKSLESIFRNSYNPVTVSCRVMPELYGWNMIPIRKDDNEK